MTKQLYEEALADVKKVKQVAEDNAKRAVLEAVTDQIREFIDQALLSDNGAEASGPGTPPGLGGEEPNEMTDIVAVDPAAQVPVDVAGPAAAITPPDAEGKVTLDIDSLCSSEPGVPVPSPMFGDLEAPAEDAEYEISLESIETLKPVLSTATSNRDISSQIKKISESVNLFKNAGKAIRATSSYRKQIAQMISRVENMYDHVQEQVTDSAKKSLFETTLEAGFKDLNKLQESMTMSQKTNKGRINEESSDLDSDVGSDAGADSITLKLTGLPSDIDLDSVGVDLITGEDEEADAGDELGDGADLDGLDDMGGQDDGSQGFDGEPQMESRKLSDDTIVEIDEKMLRREIARMKNLRENHTGTGGSETKAQSWGHGADHFDSFGGGKDDGEALDAEIVDKSPSPGALPLGEADGDLDEAQDAMDESDEALDEAEELDEAIDGPDHGGNDHLPSNKQSREPGQSAAVTHAEGVRRLGFEKKLQERAKIRAASLKREAAAAKAKKNAKRLAEVRNEYALVAKRFNESVARAKKVTLIVANAAKKLQESRSNSGTARPAENTVENASLHKKLAETNLFNAKLLYTNKLLQNEQLTMRQKAQVIKQLDSAKTIREAKLVYESLSNTLAGSSSKTVNESAQGRAVLGSASRATRPASTQQSLNEGYEAERWAQLAGINKR